MLAQGLLTTEQARHHPWAHVLTRAIGGDAELNVDYHLEALRDGDRFLLCSDGLDKELDPDEIARILAIPEPAPTAQALIAAASNAGGRDNITALVVDIFR
jgi:protein phosphatase